MARENTFTADPLGKDAGAIPVGMGSDMGRGEAAAGVAGLATGDRFATPDDPDTDGNDDAVDTLNDLLECCRDGEYGFRECAANTKAQDIQTLLVRRAGDCGAAAVELQTLIRQMDGEAGDSGTVSGAMHRGWVSVKGTLSGYSDKAMLDECERGEDSAVAQYRKALKQDLPAASRAVVERQAQGAQRNHDEIRAMRDALKSAD